MTAAARRGAVGREASGRHTAMTKPYGLLYRPCCSCGWQAETTNRKRENAVRAARRHVQEARG